MSQTAECGDWLDALWFRVDISEFFVESLYRKYDVVRWLCVTYLNGRYNLSGLLNVAEA